MNVADTLTASTEETKISPNSSVSFRGSTMFTCRIEMHTTRQLRNYQTKSIS